MEFQVIKNVKRNTKRLDAVIKFDNEYVSFDEVNAFIKSADIRSELYNSAGVILEDIGVKVVTNYKDGSNENRTCRFIVHEDHLWMNMNYKKKLVFTVCADHTEKWFEEDCSLIDSVSCYVFTRRYDNYDDENLYLIGTIHSNDFKESKVGGKQQRTKDIEKSWSDSVDELVAYRGLPSDEYVSSYLTTCSMNSGNYGKATRANKVKELLGIPLKQSSDKQRAYLSKLLDGRFPDLELSALNTYQCSALIDNLTYEPFSGADCVQNEERLMELYTFLMDRQNRGVKNF